MLVICYAIFFFKNWGPGYYRQYSDCYVLDGPGFEPRWVREFSASAYAVQPGHEINPDATTKRACGKVAGPRS